MNTANILSLARLILLVPFTVFLCKQFYGWALLFFFLAAISDLADGYVARKYNQKTRLGAFLDPLADKLLIFAGNLLLMIQTVLPFWFFIFIAVKDLSILAGVVVLRMRGVKLEPEPNRWGKIASFLQVLIILLGIIEKGFYNLGHTILTLIIICTVFTLISWTCYVAYFFTISKPTKGVDTNAG